MPLMKLAPADYVFTGNMSCPVTFAFEYAERLDPARLQRSLQQLVEIIPWLAGRLRAQSHNELAYEVTDKPRLLLEVTNSDKSFDDISDAQIVRLVKSADGEPLMRARLTQTPESSILAVSMSHALADGFSFFLAMNKWAALARGESVEAPPMVRLLQPSEADVQRAMQALDPQSLLENNNIFLSAERPEIRELPLQDQMRLSRATITEMVAEAQRDVPQKLRENDVLTAWLWRTYGAEWWPRLNNAEVYMSCPVDVRRQFGEANQSAFGLTICSAAASASFDELKHAPLGELALRIQRSVAAVFADSAPRRIAPFEALRRRHGVSALQGVEPREPERGMLVTNMSRLPLASLDMGHGAPTTLRLISEIPSMAAVLPAPDGVRVAVYRPLSHLAMRTAVWRAAAGSRSRVTAHAR
jgi:hypothetical protein